VSEFQHRSVDKQVMELALAENRILLTEDKDFGWLVFAGRVDSPGVILIGSVTERRSRLESRLAGMTARPTSLPEPALPRLLLLDSL
jgi:predicted nuclease of predicted toxin-antitoxin system